MDICRTKTDLRAQVSDWRRSGQTVGFVPTMGALHEGHLTLVRAAKAACDRVVVSIFVNPTQFGDPSDLEKYPRTEDQDCALLRAEGVDAVLMPTADEMYPEGMETIVETERLAGLLMGELRPGHYRGVCTVVTKLLNIAQPDQAFFGEKDYQQLLVIRTMARDLDMPVTIIGVPTVREADGLAMSSRNLRLTPEDRAAAVILSQSLSAAEDWIKARPTAADLEQRIAAMIASEPRAAVETVDVRHADTLAEFQRPIDAPAVILLAVRFGEILLIDQRVAAP